MTPTEKAESLYDKYSEILYSFFSDYPLKLRVKECATIAVDEILSIASSLWDNEDIPENYERIEYWSKVKEEIQKI